MSTVHVMGAGGAGAGWRDALDSLRAAPRASLLCLLAITLGVAAFATVSSIAEGMTQRLGRTFESLGAGTLVIRSAGAVPFAPDARDLRAVRQLPGVARVAVVQEVAGPSAWVEAGRRRETARVLAVSPDFFGIQQFALAQGRLPATRTRDVLLGARLARALFVTTPATSRFVRVGGAWYRVSGVLQAEDAPGKFASYDHAAIVPLAAAAKLVGHGTDGAQLLVDTREGVDATTTVHGIRDVLLRRNPALSSNALQIDTKQQLLDGARRLQASQGRTVAAISMLATVVAALGVMNMMFLAADERRREIGLRRAVGASRRDILILFLTEALVLCAIAVPVGLLLGRVTASGVQTFFQLGGAPVLSPSAVVAAIVATVGVVLVFSLAPAWQAARVDPTEALRSE